MLPSMSKPKRGWYPLLISWSMVDSRRFGHPFVLYKVNQVNPVNPVTASSRKGSQISFVCTFAGITATVTLSLTQPCYLLQSTPVILIMFVQAFTVLLPPALQATASPDQRQSIFKTSDECAKGVHIIGVRGVPGEKPGFGALQDVVDKLMDKLPGSDSVAIDYPASGLTIGDHGEPSVDLSLYRVSELFGLRKLTSEFEDHNERCPDTGIIVMGFSQASTINETRSIFHRR